MTTIKVPMVYVSVSQKDAKTTYVEYFVDDILVMDMEIDSTYIQAGEKLPLLPLTQLFVTPHAHLQLLYEWYNIASQTKAPEGCPPDHWNNLVRQTAMLLNPPADPKG
jgi:hypothetical protein